MRILIKVGAYGFRHDVNIYRESRDLYRDVEPARYYSLPAVLKDDNALSQKLGVSHDDGSFTSVWLTTSLYQRMVAQFAATETLWRGAIAMAGIRLFEARQGRLPKNLEELGDLVPKELLTDPFSGKNLVYRLAGDDFYLYSVGLDGVDGKPAKAVPYFDETEEDPDDLPDIIFHAPRQNK